MVPSGFSSFERHNRATIMSATATGGRSRVPRSWPAFWQRQTRRVVRLQWQRRRTLLVVVLMAGVGLGSSGVNAVNAPGASHGVRAQSAEAGPINADPGRPALPTDIGAMQVLSKDAPWTMKSPWPRGSAEWYPDTPVQMVVWFTQNGEGLHDASWQPNSTLGPGSQNGPYASHGCIHVPLAAVRLLFDWAPIGTPVVVYPGDGSPVADQVAQQSVDAQGNPTSGVRGD